VNSVIENLTGMNTMTDQVIEFDLLFSAKTAVRNYAIAVTEAATPEVRAILRKHLEEEIAMHEKISTYMMARGHYHAYNVGEQIQLDMRNAETALNLPTNNTSIF
jgi:similar to spore coat protein